MKCDVCSNELKSRRIRTQFTGPLGKPFFKYEIKSFCSYCQWKGNSGPGAELKHIIKEMNNQ